MSRARRICAIAALLSFGMAAVTHAQGIGEVLTAKSIPPATVALIDPESGTSSGGGGTDVRVAVGDVILFRFMYFPTPYHTIRGDQGYLTEYVPPNTQVVGVRLIDANGLTIPPNYPGITVDSCGSRCGGFTSVPCGTSPTPGSCALSDGSIAQVYADTGIFYATDGRLARSPADQFISFVNGVPAGGMSPWPTAVGGTNAIGDLVGAGAVGPYYAHNWWDWIQVRAYGISSAASGNGGQGNTPFNYGSPVAGPDTHYPFEASEVSGSVRFNGVTGPWNRIAYPGSLVGTGTTTFGGGLTYMVAPTTAGYDVTPATPLPAGTRAVRIATGDMRIGEPGWAEIALKVLALPLEPLPGMNKDIDCAEAMGSDSAGGPASVKGDNPWPFYLGAPACVYLNLLFDLTVDKPLANTGDVLTYTLHGKNLSLNPQTNVVVFLKYDSTDAGLLDATGSPTTTTCGGLSCLQWTLGTLAPSQEYTFTIRFTEGGGGHLTNVKTATYQSDALPAPGFSVRALNVSKPISRVAATLQVTTPYAAAGGSASLTGILANSGSGAGSFNTLTIILPAGWTLQNQQCGAGFGYLCLGTTPVSCSGTATSTPACALNQTVNPGQSLSLAFSVNVPAGTATGLYPVDLKLEGSQSAFGGTFYSYFHDAALVPVGAPRSSPPTITCPIISSATSITGTTTEADGTVIRLYFNGIVRGTGTAAGGHWTVTATPSPPGFGGFGPLYGGLEVRATAQAPGKLESPLSAVCPGGSVTFVHQCSDGIDNDGDGLVDFPADPDCLSPAGDSEADRPPVPPECSDGIDNDGDGLTDMADPDCRCPSGKSERRVPQCADGCDNDGDGLVDFPADPGCHSANDDDETDVTFPENGHPRVLIAVDTSGSMNFNTCLDLTTGGDGSQECPGSDVACALCGASGCDNTVADDSRLYKVKAGIADAVRAFGEVDWGLMRFHQRPGPFACVGGNVSLGSGGWQGAYYNSLLTQVCYAPFNTGDLLVRFSHDNPADLLAWMDGSANWSYAGSPPPGFDFELRGTGTTPLAGVLQSALAYLEEVRAADPKAGCRPYRVVLLTDGAENCGGDPVAAAAALNLAGMTVYVIGFALNDPAAVAQLNAIAAAGGTAQAIFVNDAVALSTAIGAIVSNSIRVEVCNGLDDDCDGVADEPWPEKGGSCSVGVGVCLRTGVYVCKQDGTGTCCGTDDGRGLGVGACLTAGAPTHVPEVCPPNGLDDDCNGVIDDIPGGCGTCTPEVCNGVDDDCDGLTDELNEVFPCPGLAPNPPNCQCPVGLSCANVGDLPSCWCPPTCGTSLGECRPGLESCDNGQLSCAGGVGPTPEVCDGKDNNCDGVIDGFYRPCYPAAVPGCDPATGQCQGICRMGTQYCPRLLQPADGNTWGPCQGAVTPQPEICNGLDDDCNGITDDVPGGCGGCVPTPEVCNGLDDDCNGIVDDNPLGEGDPCVDYDPSKAGVGICKPGRQHCQNGVFICVGEVGPQPELCNCLDDDCDGAIDNGTTCPNGFACIDCACQPACAAGEFPCAPDRRCVDPATHEPCTAAENAGCYCLPDPCVTAACDRATQRCEVVADAAVCVDRCGPDTCAPPTVCVPADGHCADCYELGCAASEVCVGSPGSCRTNPCAGVDCPADQFCQAGTCVPLCRDVACPSGEECVAGTCRKSRCEHVQCPAGQACNPDTGQCQGCASSCPHGTACVPGTGQCIPDPCLFTPCPRCTQCLLAFDGTPDCKTDEACEAGRRFVTAVGGCALAGGAPAAAPLLLLVPLLLPRVRRARRRP